MVSHYKMRGGWGVAGTPSAVSFLWGGLAYWSPGNGHHLGHGMADKAKETAARGGYVI